MLHKTLALTLPAVVLLAAGHAPPAPGLAARRAALTALLDQQWQDYLATNPEAATLLGDNRFNDRLDDRSEAAMQKHLQVSAGLLKRFEALDTAGFPVQERLSRDLMVRQLRLEGQGARFKNWEMTVFQNSGIHLDLPQSLPLAPFATVKDYEDYLSRLNQVPQAFQQTRVLMGQGMRDGIVPPRFLMPQVVAQCEAFAALEGAASPFAQPLAKFPASISAADQERLRAGILKAIREQIAPAYLDFAAFVKTEYLPKCRLDDGEWSLPDGRERYAFDVRNATTTHLTADQIHRIGLREVARIQAQMRATARKLGFADQKSFNEAAKTNPALHPKSRQAILDLYTGYAEQMNAKLPELFGRLPKARMTVLPVETFMEQGAPGAEYTVGTPDGSRPGHVMVNTGDFANRLTLSIESTALHEGLPGHHLQLSIAQEMADLPPFRQHAANEAYTEGWALYSERLGEEVGFYTDPYSYYGHLQDELLRAIRLVVDTGLHAKRWTRQQVVDYFHAHSGMEEVEVQSETDRYIVWPAQALGYKVGQLKILELREYARKELGKSFDLRGFHDVVLGSGALPMEVLEGQVKAWVESRKSKKEGKRLTKSS